VHKPEKIRWMYTKIWQSHRISVGEQGGDKGVSVGVEEGY
jgi:hypothetical protein